jgi:magnesium-protoporphyrin O-methyltransferase
VTASPPSSPPPPSTYLERRAWLEEYFDRTAADAWAALTSDAEVSGVRARVRAGRERTRATLADWLPADLAGARILDAGCGTGQLTTDLAARGATVVAVDLSRTLVDLARERLPAPLRPQVTFVAGDMLSAALGDFDFVVAMDSLIHYRLAETVVALGRLAPRTSTAMLVTRIPRTPVLGTLLGLGRLFPQRDRSPRVEPVRPAAWNLAVARALPFWEVGREYRISAGFYTSEAVELVRCDA